MPDRLVLLQSFLAANKLEDYSKTPLGGDASHRSYIRLKSETESFIVMNAPPDRGENVVPFIDVTERLRSCEYSAPDIRAKDVDNGFLVLEDLGDDLYSTLCNANEDLELVLYSEAVNLLIDLHSRTTHTGLPPYDMQTYMREVELLTQWYVGNLAPPQHAKYTAIFESLCQPLIEKEQVTVLRDYHSENLLWLPERVGLSRVGLLDYQDALAGHRAYDLVSLLEDARRDTSADLQDRMLRHYIKQSGVDETEFAKDYAILGAQRNAKIIGIFARLWLRDKKPIYINYIPRVWDHFQRNLAHPALADLKTWVDEHCPEPSETFLSDLRGRGNG